MEADREKREDYCIDLWPWPQMPCHTGGIDDRLICMFDTWNEDRGEGLGESFRKTEQSLEFTRLKARGSVVPVLQCGPTTRALR